MYYIILMIDDVSERLKGTVIAALSDEEKLELNDKEAGELAKLNPEYTICHFIESFLHKTKNIKKK